jgi:hypothetical protein
VGEDRDDTRQRQARARPRCDRRHEIRQLSGGLCKLGGLYAPQRVVVEEVRTELVLKAADEIIERAKRTQQDMLERGILKPDEVIDVDAWVEGDSGEG